MNAVKVGLLGVLTLFLIITAFGSFFTVDEGDRYIILTNGKVSGVADAGLHWKIPFFQDTNAISVREGVVTFDNIEAYTRDQQVATVTRVSVNYRVPRESVVEIYTRYKTTDSAVDQLITRRIGESLERVFGQYTAETAVKDRAKLGSDFSALIRNFQGPIEVTSVQIENFSLPDEYEKNIGDRMKAEVEVRRLEQTALQEKVKAEIVVIQAKAAADSQLAKAQANAAAVKMQGEAEAEAIRMKAAALRDNAGLIELTKAEKWDGSLPTTMVPGSTVPFLNVNK